MAGEQLSRMGSGGAGSQQAQREPAACPGSQEGKEHFGVHLTQHGQPAKRGDSPTILSIRAASP